MPEGKDTPKSGRARPTPDGAGRWGKIVAISLFAVAFLGLCYLLKGILTSLLLAFIVAYIFDPVVDFIESRQVILPNLRVPRGLAVTILITSTLLLGLTFMAYTIPRTISSANQVASSLRQKYPHYQERLERLIGEYGQAALLATLGGEEGQMVAGEAPSEPEKVVETPLPYTEKIPSGIASYLKEHLPDALQYLFNAIKKLFYSTFGLVGTLANLLTFTFVSVYLLNDYDRIINELKTFIPPARKEKTLELMGKVDDNLRGFLRGQMTVAMILGLFYSTGLSLVGVPMAFLVGFIGGIGNMVPLLGTIVGLILAMALTALGHAGEFWPFAFVGILFATGQFLDATILTPRIIGSKVGLHPVIIILSVLIWGQLLGFLGLLIAIPATSAVVVFGAEALKHYKESIRKGSTCRP